MPKKMGAIVLWKKVYDWERNIPSGHVSYFEMTRQERKKNSLPLDFSEQLFLEMVEWLPEKEEVEPKDGVLMDTITINQQIHQMQGKGKEKYQGAHTTKEAFLFGKFLPILFCFNFFLQMFIF